MKDFLQKTFLFGLGVVDFTKEKVEGLVAEMVKRGEITQQETPETMEQIMARAKEAQKALFDKVKELVGKAILEMKLARAADVEALEKRLSALEKVVQDRSGSK